MGLYLIVSPAHFFRTGLDAMAHPHSCNNQQTIAERLLALRAIALQAAALRFLALRFIMVYRFTVYRFTVYRFTGYRFAGCRFTVYRFTVYRFRSSHAHHLISSPPAETNAFMEAQYSCKARVHS